MLELDGLFKNALSTRAEQLQLKRFVVAAKKKNRQQQQTLRLGEGGRHRGEIEREHAEEVIKGKHEGRRGVGDKEVRWGKGDLHVCEDDRAAECFAGGGYFWNWIILGVNWSGWMNAKARKVWSHKDAIPAALCLLQQKTASGFCFLFFFFILGKMSCIRLHSSNFRIRTKSVSPDLAERLELLSFWLIFFGHQALCLRRAVAPLLAVCARI